MSTKSKFKGLVACTKAQFDAITAKNSDKIYLITDDDQEQSGGAPVYVHVLNFTHSAGSNVFIGFTMIISKSATPVTDLAGIKALLGNSFYYPCWAYYEDTSTIFLSMNDQVFLSIKETTTKSWTGVSISDKVMSV